MRKAVLVIVTIGTASCGDDRGGSPATPSPMPQTQTFTLSGTVSETAPTASTRIAGAAVMAIAGLENAGPSTTTDANGAFQLSLAPGAYTVRAYAEHYVEQSQPLTLTADQAVSAELDPVFQMVTTTKQDAIASDASCPGYWDYAKAVLPRTKASGPCQVDYVVNVHHDGSLTAGLAWADSAVGLATEIYLANGGLASGAPLGAGGDGSMQGASHSVLGHNQYVVRVRKFSNGGGPPPAGTTQFTLTVTHPN